MDNRIVQVEVLNSGSRFKRLPSIKVVDAKGFGAKLSPIMNVVAKPEAKALPDPVRMIYCPSKTLRNE